MTKEPLLIKGPGSVIVAMGDTVATTRNEAFTGITPVLPATDDAGKYALWGPANDHPQRVIKDKERSALIGGVIEKKSKMLISGGLRYGTIRTDPNTGLEMMIPIRVNEIDDWLENSNIALYLREATNDWYTQANLFPEVKFNKGFNYINEIGVHDASQVRLGIMDKNAVSKNAYLADFTGGSSGTAISVPAIDPYSQPVRQMLEGRKPRYIIPIRELIDGRFYYGRPAWNGLRVNGWLDVHLRIPELKAYLLKHMLHLRYHIEIDERFWLHKYKEWESKKEDERLELMQTEVRNMVEHLEAKGQGGALMTEMVTGQDNNASQISLVKVHDLKLTIAEGAYIEDSAEADFVMVRDMGLAPALYGISPSKSRASSGSGSEDRVLRTNHLLDSKPDADMILSPLNYVTRINKWHEKYGKGQRLVWWMANYYAATLDRTMQVADLQGYHTSQTGNNALARSMRSLSKAVDRMSVAIHQDRAA